jgi:hypothetical protein
MKDIELTADQIQDLNDMREELEANWAETESTTPAPAPKIETDEPF